MESRAGGVGNPMWKPFQDAAQRNVRGGMFRRTPLGAFASATNKMGAATQKCRETCDKREECCMMCVKPVRGQFECYMYNGRFGGKSEQEIEGLSMQSRNDEKCSFKTEFHDHKTCTAQ